MRKMSEREIPECKILVREIPDYLKYRPISELLGHTNGPGNLLIGGILVIGVLVILCILFKFLPA